MKIINSVLNGAPISSSGYKYRRANDAEIALQTQDRPREATVGKPSLEFIEANANAARARIQMSSDMKSTQTDSKVQSTTEDYSKWSLGDRLALVRQEGSQVDRTNMSDREVFEEIYARFSKYLTNPGEFPLVSYAYDFVGKNDISDAYNDELFALERLGWTVAREQNAYAEMKGYGGMSAGEMKQAIVQKYASEGSMTAYRFCAMMDEMSCSGAMDGHEASAIAGAVGRSVSAQVDSYFGGKGYTYDALYGKNYLQITSGKYLDMYNQPTSFSALHDTLTFYMTIGGYMSEDIRNAINDFFTFLNKSGLM